MILSTTYRRVAARTLQPFVSTSYKALFSSKVEEDKITNEEITSNSLSDPKDYVTTLGTTSLKGVGQVIFLNSPISGGVLLASLAVGGGPYLAGLATIGTLSANAFAHHYYGADDAAYNDGLYGYNGCLVGCAASVFIAPTSIPLGLLTTTLVGAATPLVMNHAMKPMMGQVPQWTLAFNAVTMSSMLVLQSRPLADAPPLPEYTDFMMNLCLTAPLNGISQIFVVQSPLAGAMMVGGMAYYSPGLAGHALLGSSIGALTGCTIMGAPLAELDMGLWGFNSALTSLGVGVFYVHNNTSVMALSAGGAAATAVLFGLMKGAFGSGLDMPCLTLPFCITMTGCYLANGAISSWKLASSPHSPEKNE